MRVARPSVRRGAWWLLVVGEVVLALSLLQQWLCVGTYHLYLDKRMAPEAAAPAARAREHFVLRDGRVDPQILATENEHLLFPVDFTGKGELRLEVLPRSRATVEIAVVQKSIRRTLYRRTLSEATQIVQPLPPKTGVIELFNVGELKWSNARLVQEPGVTSWLLGLLVLLAATGLGAGGTFPPGLPSWARTAVLGGLTAAIAALLCVVGLEVSLRALGQHLPSWMIAQRQNLGEVYPDPRWQDSVRYGPRLAPGLRTVCEWQHGDIVRLGYLPPDLVGHAAYRFPFVTDAEGFRNSETASPSPEVVALGDSFTDAMTLPVELGWPSRLASHLGVSVRNYGTAGFGPPQELRVLEEYALPRRPRFVVVAFFAGNDLQDAARFEQKGSVPATPGLGWKFKDVVARFDQLYVTSLYEGAVTLLRSRDKGPASPSSAERLTAFSGEDPGAPPASRPAFDRGLFAVPVGGRTVRFAFLPPYLNCLKLSREELQASHGWEVTQASYRQMERLARARGSRLLVVFIPSKAQVYLPLLEASFEALELQQAIRYCFRDQPYAPTLDVMMRNRLALNDLMRAFCAAEGIPFLDLTPDLQSTLAAGQNVYFPDDSHWNAAGHEVGAMAIARFMRTEPSWSAPQQDEGSRHDRQYVQNGRAVGEVDLDERQ